MQVRVHNCITRLKTDLYDAQKFSRLLCFDTSEFEINVACLILGSGRLQLQIERHHSSVLGRSSQRFMLGVLCFCSEDIELPEILNENSTYSGGNSHTLAAA